MTDQPTYFIGYDAREHEAACVAAYSIARRANSHSRIYILEHMELRRLGMFDREWSVDKQGQFYDDRDGRPFSTGFSHSRFLAPYLASELKCTGPCMFLDCDWLFLDDPGKVMKEQWQHPNQIGVVMRDRVVQEGSTKMDGMVQENYSRKLWSALFTFIPSPDLAKAFSPAAVNHLSGRGLHGFLDLAPNQFWPIDPAWHYIPSLDERPDQVRGIHFSEFSPWLNPEKYEENPDAFDLWLYERKAWLEHAVKTEATPPWRDLTLDLKAASA